MPKEMLKGLPEEVQEAAVVLASATEVSPPSSSMHLFSISQRGPAAGGESDRRCLLFVRV